MAGLQKIYHMGKEIIYVDYRGMKEEEMLATAQSLKVLLLRENKPHLRLVNISECFAKPKFTAYIREMGNEISHIPVKAAVVGITGAKKVLLMGYNRILGGSMRPFDHEEDAKNYLVI